MTKRYQRSSDSSPLILRQLQYGCTTMPFKSAIRDTCTQDPTSDSHSRSEAQRRSDVATCGCGGQWRCRGTKQARNSCSRTFSYPVTHGEFPQWSQQRPGPSPFHHQTRRESGRASALRIDRFVLGRTPKILKPSEKRRVALHNRVCTICFFFGCPS